MERSTIHLLNLQTVYLSIINLRRVGNVKLSAHFYSMFANAKYYICFTLKISVLME